METPKNKRTPSAYNLFMKDWMSKRPDGKLAKDWMKEIGNKWKAQKGLTDIGKTAVKCRDAGYIKKSECPPCASDTVKNYMEATKKNTQEMTAKASTAKKNLTERLKTRKEKLDSVVAKRKKLVPLGSVGPVDEMTQMYGIEGLKK
jgi:hypothetical protein